MKRECFNNGWLFKSEGKGSFIKVSLPHDAMQTEKRVGNALSGPAGAYYPGNKYVYRKQFNLANQQIGKAILEVGGIYQHSTVKLNGKILAKVPYGYRPFMVDLTSELKFDFMNELEIDVDNSRMPNSRWYSGAGIFRSIYLWTGSQNGLTNQDVKISTIAISPAKIKVQLPEDAGARNIKVLRDREVVATANGTNVILNIPHAQLWSAETPYLYQCVISTDDDTLLINFGIRQLKWKSGIGLTLNGKSILLRGGGIHHDNGVVGAESYHESEYRRVKKLKSYGFNAIRSAHNPASTGLLEACDKLGMYVIDEMWDMWYEHKTSNDYASDFIGNYQQDISDVVKRDYNHCAVIIYSIGNELSEPSTKKGVLMAQTLVKLFHRLDPSRPTTAGINLMILGMAAMGDKLVPGDGQKGGNQMDSTEYNKTVQEIGTQVNNYTVNPRVDKATSPVLDVLDIAGYNYGAARYEQDKEEHPNRLIVGTETYPQDLYSNWRKVKRLPNIIGDFMWTAWDYIGEAGIGAWSYNPEARNFFKPYPWKLAGAGAIDINGNPTGEALWAKAIWHRNKGPLIAVRPLGHTGEPFKSAWRGTNAIPSWTWLNCEGQVATVEVYYDCSSIELLLNGKKIERKSVEQARAMFKVPYKPGQLLAKAYDEDGELIASSNLSTATNVKLRSKREEKNTNDEIHYVDIWLGDEAGNFVGNADYLINFKLKNGQLLGLGSSIARTPEEYSSSTCHLFQGRALAILRGDNLDFEITHK